MTIASLPLETDEDFYPTGDGKPMAETELHLIQILHLIDALKTRYAREDDVYVCGNNFIYYEQGNRRASVSPDCYVVRGVPKRIRDSYRVWEEGGKTPDVVFEITSKSTKQEDTDRKHPIYEQVLHVQEYFMFDPTGDYLTPPMQGYRLVNGRYQPIAPVEGRLHSEQLGLDLIQDGNNIGLFDPETQEFLWTHEELAWRYEVTLRRAGVYEAMADELQEANRLLEKLVRDRGSRTNTSAQGASIETYAETEAQRAREARQRAETEAQRADEAVRHADEETQRANEEARIRAEAEAEIARLRAELAVLRGNKQD